MAEARERESSYAWVVVGVLFFAQAMAMGVRGTIGLLVKPWEAEFGWDRAALSLTAALGSVVFLGAAALSGAAAFMSWAISVAPAPRPEVAAA